ncbi:MAG: hypothetical protein QOF60_2458 [Actinomycetota bacterium]|jgi:hypothetical protein|nr:hypothetical protein [Actinomycetota bacterium]
MGSGRRVVGEEVGDGAVRQGPKQPGAATGAGSTIVMVDRLQRAVGNAAVTALLARGGPLSLQRIRVDLPAGGSVGEGATNSREGVKLVLDRLHVLWAITNDEFDRVYPGVSALAPGDPVTDAATLRTVRNSLARADEPTLAAAVAQAQFNLPVSASVGRAQPNSVADILMLQDLLHTHWHLTNDAYDRERAAVLAGRPRTSVNLSQTYAGITKLKRAAIAGTGKQGWDPLIRADEAGPPGPGGTDRLADRSFQYDEFLVFVPSGAVASAVNRVHVFFSAGGVVGADSHTEHHGLRGAAESHDWILVGVPGEVGVPHGITLAQIREALESTGRAARVDAVRMSAHSRGNGGLAKTLRRRLIDPSLIEHVTVLDGSDFHRSLTAGFRSSRIPPANITADFVTTGPFPMRGVRSQGMDAEGIRAIGYARLINDAVTLGRVSALPPAIAGLVSAVTLPSRGSFSANSPPPAGKTSINAFVRANRAALRGLLVGERSVNNVGQLSSARDTSPYAFVEWNNLLNINDPNAPRDQWRSVSAGIYSHHLFVAEVADDLFA